MLRRNAHGRAVGVYSELVPDELEQALAEQAIIYLPTGAVEWHNTHLPYNTDSLIAEGLCARLAERTGGLLLPANPWACACTAQKRGPYRFAPALGTVALFDGDLHRRLLQAIADGVLENGFKRLVILAGHVGLQDRDSIEAVVGAVNAGGAAKALFLYPYLRTKGDHAGHWETLMLLGLRPELVRTGKTYIPYEHGHPLQGNETAEQGRQKIDALIDLLMPDIGAFFGDAN